MASVAARSGADEIVAAVQVLAPAALVALAARLVIGRARRHRGREQSDERDEDRGLDAMHADGQRTRRAPGDGVRIVDLQPVV
jgi:hypothetical protein